MSSGWRLASGKGASATSINSTVATDVGLQAGVRSTGSRRKAASTRWRLFMAPTILFSSFLLARRHQQAAPFGRFLFPQDGANIERAWKEQPHQGIMRLPAGKRHLARTSLVSFNFG